MCEIWLKMYIGHHMKCPLFLSDFNGTWIFSVDLKKITWKDAKWELSHSKQTDMMQVIAAFHNNFMNAPTYGMNFDEIC